MLHKLVSILLVIAPAIISAQTINKGDAGYEERIKSECRLVFTKSEELPSFKISKQALEDSITVYLKATNAFDTKTKFTFQFLLTTASQIYDVRQLRGGVPGADFTKALLNFSSLWSPAKQNGREVCAFVKCKVDVQEDRMVFTLFQ